MSAAPLRRPTPAVPVQPRKAAATRPHLAAVAAPEQARSLVPFAWTCLLIVVGALTAVLLINTTMSQGAYERRALKIEIAQLHQQRASLVSELEANSSPTHLAAAASALGMELADTRGFISLTDGAVLQQGKG
ncbi:hypothetical protein [Demequina sp.]|uniref:hypothetical protein n=1 Tax=Demequina sp. TaxID=2050685 RepID=UPI003A8A9072